MQLFLDYKLVARKRPSRDMIKHAEIDINVAVLALVILILSGVIAGAFPAMKASVIQPIDAIRNENIG